MQTVPQTFQSAVALAQSGETATAHAILAQLRATQPDTVELALWFAFTSSDKGEAKAAIEAAARIDPKSQLLEQAQKWLREWQYTENQATSKALIATLPEHLKAVTEQELMEGETVLWLAKPNPWRVLQRELVFLLMVVPGLIVASIGINAIMGAPMLTMGMIYRLGRYAIIYGPVVIGTPAALWLAYNRAVHMAYILTSKRLIFISKQWFDESVQSYKTCNPMRFDILERPDHSGNLLMGEEVVGTGKDTRITRVALIGIPDVRKVAQLIQDTLPHAYY